MSNVILSSLVAVYSSILMIAGTALIYIGMRVSPTPFLGAKIGYAYVSRKLWREANIVSGTCMLIIACIALLLHYLAGVDAITTVFISVLGIVATLFGSVEYLSRRAEKELLAIPAESTKPEEHAPRFDRIQLALPVGMISAILIAIYAVTLVYAFPHLPENVAIHFDASGNPDSYIPRDSALPLLAFPIATTAGLTSFIVYAGLKRPEIFYRPRIPWSTMKRIVNAVTALLCLVNLAVTIALIDTICYNLYGHHIADISILVLTTIGPATALAAYMVFLAIRTVRS